MKDKKTILVAPLDWGLGHAVRMIPIVHLLKNEGYRIVLGGTRRSGEIIREEFPEIKYYELPGADIRYSGKFFILKLLLQIPKFLFFIRKEKTELKRILNNENIDLIISDNRYGIYHKNIPSFIVCHQIRPKLSKGLTLFDALVEKLQKRFLKPFNQVIVPDYKGKINLTGDLSHSKYSKEYCYIGPVTQFKNDLEKYEQKYDSLIILSGPEPQRTIFEETIVSQIKDTDKKVLLVRGKPDKDLSIQNENIETIDHLSRSDMEHAIKSSDSVISRAGYTSIMDLLSLHKKAILIPTPGQTEQEYLARHLSKYALFLFKDQYTFDLKVALRELKQLRYDFNLFDDLETDSLIDLLNKYV